jgi:hypothetical protein
MRKKLLTIATLIAVGLQTASAQDAKQTVRDMAVALGMLRGANRVDAVSTQEMWATGTVRVMGQNGAPATTEKVTAYHAWFDYNLPGMRVELTRTNGGTGSMKQGNAVSGKYAWNESEPGAGLVPGKGTVTNNAAAAAPRLLRVKTMPYALVKAAMKAGDKVQLTMEGGARVLVIPLDAEGLPGVTARATLDDKNFISKVVTSTSNPAQANLNTETTYSGYKDLDEPLLQTDVMFPAHIVVKQGKDVVLDLTVSKVDANNPYLVIPVPEAIEKSAS